MSTCECWRWLTTAPMHSQDRQATPHNANKAFIVLSSVAFKHLRPCHVKQQTYIAFLLWSLINQLWWDRAQARLSAGCLQDASPREFVCLAREGCVTAELDKTGEGTGLLARTAAAMLVQIHTRSVITLARGPRCYLKPSHRSLTGFVCSTLVCV